MFVTVLAPEGDDSTLVTLIQWQFIQKYFKSKWTFRKKKIIAGQYKHAPMGLSCEEADVASRPTDRHQWCCNVPVPQCIHFDVDWTKVKFQRILCHSMPLKFTFDLHFYRKLIIAPSKVKNLRVKSNKIRLCFTPAVHRPICRNL